MTRIKAWVIARRWRKAIRYFDLQIRDARKAHKPVNHIVKAKQDFLHDVLRRGIGA